MIYRRLEGVIIGVDIYQKIRYMYQVQKKGKKTIARELGISRNTVKKYCEGSHVPWNRKEYNRDASVITDDVLDFIKQCLDEDEREGLKKQTHTAKRIYTRLVEEKGFTGGESTIRLAVQNMKNNISKAFVPLAFDPGEAAQLDWGESYVYINGIRKKIYVFCMRLCYSCDIFVMAFYRQNEESFLEGHIKAFEFFKGVPKRLIFDNAKVAVKEGFGKYAKPQEQYYALSAHYAFEMNFCNPGKGNEKGLIENLVGWSRRNMLVPVPKVNTIDELNQILYESCLKYRAHQIKGHTMTVGEMYDIEKSILMPLPPYTYDPAKSVTPRVNEYSLIRFDRNSYSVPVKYVGKEVSVKGYGNKVKAYYKGEEIATHTRSYERNGIFTVVEHYIDLLERKPRAVFNARPIKDNIEREILKWGMQFPGGAQDIVKLLRLSVDYGIKKLLHVREQMEASITPTIDIVLGYLIPENNIEPIISVEDSVKVHEVNLEEYDLQIGVM